KVLGINAAGQVVCGQDIDTQNVYSGNDFAVSNQSCGVNEKVLGINAAGQVVCGQDIDTQNVYSGNDFAVSNQSCGVNEKVLGISAAGQVVCGQDIDTAYTGDDFAVSGQSCPEGHVMTGVDERGSITCKVDFVLNEQTCGPGQLLQGVDDQGQFVCANDQNTTYTGGDFALSDQACPQGQRVTGVDQTGTVTCAIDIDTNTQRAAGSGLTLNGNTLSLDATGCVAGEVLKRNGANDGWECVADVDTDTNTQLTENQVVTFVSNNGFVRDVDLANIATTASFNDLVNVPAGLADGDDNTQRAAGSGLALNGNTLSLDATGCVAGEVLKRNATNDGWECVADVGSDSELTENDVLNIVSQNGYVRDVDLANIATTASFNDLVNVPAGLADGDDNTQRAAGSGLALNGNTLSLDTTGCVAGEVLKRNGANDGWECVADVDTDTNTQLTENQVVTFVSNNGFVRDVELANIATTASFNDLVNVPAGLADGDDNTKRAAFSCLALNGNTLSLDTTGCVAGEVLKRNGANNGWECVADVDTDTNTQLTENQVVTFVSNNGFVRDVELANIATTASFNDLVNVPAGLADGDDNTQRAAGSGLALNGNTLSLDTTGCVAGEVLKRNGANDSWECVADVDTNTQLTDNEVINIVSNANYVRTLDLSLAAFTASFTDLVNVPAGLADGDDDTQRAAGDGLALNGNTLSVDSAGCIGGQVLARSPGNNGWQCVSMAIAAQSCMPGFVVTGFNASGQVVCTELSNGDGGRGAEGHPCSHVFPCRDLLLCMNGFCAVP
ncbi:MAG: hypothetical protein ACON3Z_20220, partial [Bradymonadia bacterium]